MWDFLKKRRREYPQARDLDQLWKRCEEVWNAIAPEYCKKLVRTMSQRLKGIRKSKGGYTNF